MKKRNLLEQCGERRLANHTALQQRRQDGELVVERLAKATAVIQMNREGVISEFPASTRTYPSKQPRDELKSVRIAT